LAFLLAPETQELLLREAAKALNHSRLRLSSLARESVPVTIASPRKDGVPDCEQYEM